MIPIRGSLRGRASPALVIVLVLVNVLVFLNEASLGPRAFARFQWLHGFIPARDLASGSIPVAVLAALQSMFVHGGWAHLVGNMLYLWVFGSGLESRLGHARFAIIYFASGILAAQAQGLVDPTSTIAMVGASGAIAGVLGAYFVVSPRARLTVLFPIWIIPLFFEVPAVVFLGLWFLMQFLSGTRSLGIGMHGGIAWWAHVAGFLAGAVLVRVLGVPPIAPRRDPWGSDGLERRYGW